MRVRVSHVFKYLWRCCLTTALSSCSSDPQPQFQVTAYVALIRVEFGLHVNQLMAGIDHCAVWVWEAIKWLARTGLPAFPCFSSLLPLRPLCPPSHLLLSWRRTSPLVEGKTFIEPHVQCVEIWSVVPPQLPLMMENAPIVAFTRLSMVG